MAYRLVRLSNLSDPPVNCKIVIAPGKDIFEPGDKVDGILIVSHQRDLVLRGFKVVLEGSSLTKYKEHEIVHSKSEEFLAEPHYVFGHEGQRNRLAGGGTAPKVHKFPFRLKIPLETLPGSFKSPFGITLYQIVAYMHMDPIRFVKKAEKTIHLNGRLVLANSWSMNSTTIEKAIQRLKFKLCIPHTGYLAGEEIPFQFELENPNGGDVASIVVALVQRTTYKAGHVSRLSKTNSTVLGSVETNTFDSTNGTFWTNALRIPSKQRPTQQGGIIEIQYILKVEVNTIGATPGLRGETTVIIGSTRSGRAEAISHAIPSAQNTASLENQKSDIGSDYSKAHPPSYSALSSRRPSVETLPPEYEDLEFDMNKYEIEKLDSLKI